MNTAKTSRSKYYLDIRFNFPLQTKESASWKSLCRLQDLPNGRWVRGRSRPQIRGVPTESSHRGPRESGEIMRQTFVAGAIQLIYPGRLSLRTCRQGRWLSVPCSIRNWEWKWITEQPLRFGSGVRWDHLVDLTTVTLMAVFYGNQFEGKIAEGISYLLRKIIVVIGESMFILIRLCFLISWMVTVAQQNAEIELLECKI